MGRRTKKEKIIADLRRKLVKSKIPSEDTQKPKVYSHLDTDSSSSEGFQSQSIYVYPVQLVRKDLTKTFLLTILALSFEFGLYFLTRKKINLPIINLNLPMSLSFR